MNSTNTNEHCNEHHYFNKICTRQVHKTYLLYSTVAYYFFVSLLEGKLTATKATRLTWNTKSISNHRNRMTYIKRKKKQTKQKIGKGKARRGSAFTMSVPLSTYKLHYFTRIHLTANSIRCHTVNLLYRD